MINKNLSDLLQKLEKEKKNVETFFLLPSGLLRGNFEKYNQNEEFVTLSNCYLSNTKIETKITIWVGIIHGWGTK